MQGKGIDHLQPLPIFGTEMVNQADDLIKEKTGMMAKEPQFKPIQRGMIQWGLKQIIAHKPFDQDVIVNLFFGLAQREVV
jgi:hypothetical protein